MIPIIFLLINKEKVKKKILKYNIVRMKIPKLQNLACFVAFANNAAIIDNYSVVEFLTRLLRAR